MATKHTLHITIDPKTGVDKVLREKEINFLELANQFNLTAPKGQKVLSVPKDPKKRAALTEKMMSHIAAHKKSQRAPSA